MKMDTPPHPILTNVMEVISVASEATDCSVVRQKVLDLLFRTISAEGGVFFLPDGNTHFTNIMLKDLEEKYCGYYKSYFCQFDPLQLTSGTYQRNGVNHPVHVFNYDYRQPTEYYNDFLSPQKIHYKLIINLQAEQRLLGRVVLTRPQKSNNFSLKDIRTAKTLSPYLAHALAYNDLRKKIALKGNILNFIEKQSSTGRILLDEKLRIIYRNQKANELLGHLMGSGRTYEDQDLIWSQLLKDCREMRADLKDCPVDGLVFPRNRVVKGFFHTHFSVNSQVFTQEPGWESSRLFMISIEELSSSKEFDPRYFADTFHLSRREVDVASLLFSGLKNAEIGEKLFISEITVKKHLQNIYAKVGVNNRTSLMNRMLT